MKVRTYPLVRGLASYVLPMKLFKRPGSGGTFSSEYCYSVWLRHLVKLRTKGFIQSVNEIKSVAEIGPGDSLGMGLAAIYTGAESYYAFDVIRHTDIEHNRAMNDALLQLFLQRRDIPYGTPKFSRTKPALDDYSFPHDILPYDDAYYRHRHALIGQYLDSFGTEASGISYVVPWMGQQQHQVKDIDLIISQAVMEHVSDVEFAYAEMYRWLKKGGIISHQVDFRAHEMTKEWDGHFYIGPGMWRILAHGRKYPMNRLPYSAHLKAITAAGFTIKNVQPVPGPCHFPGKTPQVPGVQFTEEDLVTTAALIQGIK